MKRIFIGPVSIAGMDLRLAAALEGLGVDAHVINLTGHVFSYGAEAKGFVRIIQRIHALGDARSGLTRKAWRALGFGASLIHGLVSLFCHDRFIFFFGRSLLPRNLDLPILKLLGKKAVMVYCGSDSRPPYLNYHGVFRADGTASTVDQLRDDSRRIFRNVRRVTSCIPSTDALLSSHFHTRPFINQFRIGFPTILENSDASVVRDSSRAVRVLHCPSNPGLKGTRFIEQAIENIQKRMKGIEFVLIRDRSNSEVLQQIRAADFVVDQLYSDTPMAGFATEAAAHGVPAIVGGYGWEQIRNRIGDEWLPPSLLCHPDEIEQSIEKMILDPEYRVSLGKAARRFVEEKWAPRKVAERLLRILDDDIPDDWWIDPGEIEFSLGAGLTEEAARQAVSLLVSKYGPDALCLDHLPKLRSQYVEYARGNSGSLSGTTPRKS